MPTRSQQYAVVIYDQVAEISNKDEAYNKVYKAKYGSMAHKLPVLIRTAGLAQALAFVEARNEEPSKMLLFHLSNAIQKVAGESNLITRSRDAGLDEYMRLTREALTALLWYKRFAQSVLKVDASTSDNQIGGK